VGSNSSIDRERKARALPPTSPRRSGVSISYQRSNSFLPADSAYNLFLEQLPNHLQSKEYGLRSICLTSSPSGSRTRDRAGSHRAGTAPSRRAVLGMTSTRAARPLTFTSSIGAIHNGWRTIASRIIPTSRRSTQRRSDWLLHRIHHSAAGKTIADASDATSKGWELELQSIPPLLDGEGDRQSAGGHRSNISLFSRKHQPAPAAVADDRAPTDRVVDTVQGQQRHAPRLYRRTSRRRSTSPSRPREGQAGRPASIRSTSSPTTNSPPQGLTDGRTWLKNMSVGGSYRWAARVLSAIAAGVPVPTGPAFARRHQTRLRQGVAALHTRC